MPDEHFHKRKYKKEIRVIVIYSVHNKKQIIDILPLWTWCIIMIRNAFMAE